MNFSRSILVVSFGFTVGACSQGTVEPTEAETNTAVEQPLSAFNDTAAKSRIVDFVKAATTPGSEGFIPESDRIAVFDNDGTLWPEQPIPNQLQFHIDYLKSVAPDHPDWEKNPAIAAAIKGDLSALKKTGMDGLKSILSAAAANITEAEYQAAVQTWMDTARDDRFNRPYGEVVYEPMVQLLHYLRANGFTTFIVSGGGADFMRPWTEEVYGIPPYQVVGSYGDATYEIQEGKPIITKTTGGLFVNDKTGKPIAIHRFIGKVPVICVGNSDGDQDMMQYTHASLHPSLCVILHHTDAEREFAYDTITVSGHLQTALIEAREKDWLVVDMKRDFKRIFAFE